MRRRRTDPMNMNKKKLAGGGEYRSRREREGREGWRGEGEKGGEE